MRLFVKVIVSIAFIGLLAGCSTQKNVDYVKSENGNRLIVKPPKTRQFIDDTFVLPNVGKIEPESELPPGLHLPKSQVKKTKREKEPDKSV